MDQSVFFYILIKIGLQMERSTNSLQETSWSIMFSVLILKEGREGKMESLTGNREEAVSYLREERGSLEKNLSPRMGEV